MKTFFADIFTLIAGSVGVLVFLKLMTLVVGAQ